MKKLILLVCLFVGIGLSAKVMAQSTGTNPQPGAKHHYQVNGGNNTNSTYLWSVKKVSADGNSLSDAGADAIITEYTASAGIDKADVYIQWAAGLAAGTKYFVVVKETSKATACSNNSKAFVVTIATKTFNLAITADNTNGCYTNEVVVTSVSGNPTYTHGAATLKYTVTPTGLGSGQKFSFTVEPPVIAGYSVGDVTVTNGTNSGNNISSTDHQALTLTYVITKNDPTTNASPDDSEKFTATAAIKTATGVSSSGVTSLETSGTQSASSVVDRPNTSSIVPMD